jgi:hypothetical protein
VMEPCEASWSCTFRSRSLLVPWFGCTFCCLPKKGSSFLC